MCASTCTVLTFRRRRNVRDNTRRHRVTRAWGSPKFRTPRERGHTAGRVGKNVVVAESMNFNSVDRRSYVRPTVPGYGRAHPTVPPGLCGAETGRDGSKSLIRKRGITESAVCAHPEPGANDSRRIIDKRVQTPVAYLGKGEGGYNPFEMPLKLKKKITSNPKNIHSVIALYTNNEINNT